jgi:hypothetical protein
MNVLSWNCWEPPNSSYTPPVGAEKEAQCGFLNGNQACKSVNGVCES